MMTAMTLIKRIMNYIIINPLFEMFRMVEVKIIKIINIYKK